MLLYIKTCYNILNSEMVMTMCPLALLTVMTFGIFSYFVPTHFNLTTRGTVTNADPQQNLYNVPEHTNFPEGEVRPLHMIY